MNAKNNVGFGRRLATMLRVDMRRMGRSRLFCILVAVALVIPVLMTVMMTMMDGTVSLDPQTGVETVMKGPESSWQAIGALPLEEGEEPMGGMDVMSMCNIDMMFMLSAVFTCLFICEDFRSGYAKNLFTVRAKKGDYVFSKTLCGIICCSIMLIAYFIGAMIGGAVSGLSFDLGALGIMNVVFCILSKLMLSAVFTPIFVAVSVGARQKAWLAICGSLAVGMLLFMTVSLISPLSATVVNVILCAVGGTLFSALLGLLSKQILNKVSLV